MKNYLTIYLQYINGNPKISINIKVSSNFFKRSYQLIDNELIDERNIWGAFRHAKVG